jgi:hypothetical protein
MVQVNSSNISFSEEDVTAINGAITLLREKFIPVLKSLNPDTRRQLAKMGNKSFAFVIKSLEYCENNSELVPQFVNVEGFRKAVRSFEQMRLFHGSLSQINEMLSHSMIIVGSEAYASARVVYRNAQIGKKMDIPKAETICDDLSARFPGKKKKKNNGQAAE